MGFSHSIRSRGDWVHLAVKEIWASSSFMTLSNGPAGIYHSLFYFIKILLIPCIVFVFVLFQHRATLASIYDTKNESCPGKRSIFSPTDINLSHFTLGHSTV